MNKVKSTALKTIAKINKAKYMLLAVVASTPVLTGGSGIAFASSGIGKTQGSDIVKTVLDQIAKVMPLLGAIFAFSGIIKLVQAFRNDNNPEAMASGGKDLAVGVVLIVFDLLLWGPIEKAIW